MKIIVFLLSIFLLSGCKEKVNEIDSISFNINNTVEVYSDVYLYDLLSNIDDIEIISDNYKIDTDLVESSEYEIIFKSDKKNFV